MARGERVTALDLPEAKDPDPDNAAYFQKFLDKLGLVPNVLRAYAWNQRKLRNFIALYNELMLGESGLTKLERKMIAVAVSAANRCYYCEVAHGAALRELSGEPELGEALALNYRVAALPPRQRAMLDFAVMLTEQSHRIDDAERARLTRFVTGDTERQSPDRQPSPTSPPKRSFGRPATAEA